MTDFPESNRFPLTITKEMVKNSIFPKQKMTERCNVGKLLGVIKRKEGEDIGWSNEYPAFPYKNENPMLKDYYNTFKQEEFHTSYYQSKHKYGRCMPKDYLSLSVFRRALRHSFAEGIYKDIDMRNAHPVILSTILTQHTIPCESLSYYAMNPAEVRQSIMDFYDITKDEAKQLIFRMVFGGSYCEWCQERGEDRVLPFLLALERELTNIQIVIHSNNKETIVKEVKKADPTKWANESAERRGVMGLFAQTVERLIQEKAIAWLVSQKGFPLHKIVPSQDGFMILEEYWYDGLTDDINRVIETEMNIPIEFIVKPFDEAIEIEEWFGKSYPEWIDDLSCKRLADRFLVEFGDRICMYQQPKTYSLYVFDGNRWFDQTDKDSRFKITNLLSETLYDIIKEELDEDCSVTAENHFKLAISLRTNTSTNCNLANFYLHLLANVRRIPVDFNSNQFIIGFENGLYDLKKSEFRPYTFEDYVTITTGYDYAECDPAKKEVLLGIFKEIIADPEKYGAFMRILASGLDGLNHQHLFLFNGTGRNGKGFTTRLMKRALGNYFYQGSNEVIKDSVKTGSATPLLYDLKNKRYVVFPEVAGLIKNDLLKLLTGGDAVNARLLNKNPESFSLCGTFVLEFNKPPELEQKCGHSERERIVDLDFPVNFTSDEEEILKGGNYKRGNPEYTKDDWLDSHRLEMLHILLDVYREHKQETGGIDFKIPKCLRQRTEAFIDNQNPFNKLMKEYFVVDEKAKEVKLKWVWDKVKELEEYRSMTARQKREYSRDELYDYVKKNYETKTTDQVTVVYKIRFLNPEYDEPDNI